MFWGPFWSFSEKYFLSISYKTVSLVQFCFASHCTHDIVMASQSGKPWFRGLIPAFACGSTGFSPARCCIWNAAYWSGLCLVFLVNLNPSLTDICYWGEHTGPVGNQAHSERDEQRGDSIPHSPPRREGNLASVGWCVLAGLCQRCLHPLV